MRRSYVTVTHHFGRMAQTVCLLSAISILVLLLWPLAPSTAGVIDVPFYSQRDREWDDHPLGQAMKGQTIGDFGCGVTSAAMILPYYGSQGVTPALLNDALTQSGAFKGSNLIWDAEKWRRATGDAITSVADYRPWHPDWKHHQQILQQHVEIGHPVIVYLGNAHYVVVTRYDPQTDQFFINDPWLDQEKGADIPFDQNAKGLSLSDITQMVILYPATIFPPDVDWPAIREKYIQLGGEKGMLGASSQDDEEFLFPNGQRGRVQRFASGTIYAFPDSAGTWQAYWMVPVLANAYERHLQELGLPRGDIYSSVTQHQVKAGRVDFEHGSLIYYLGDAEPELIVADQAFRGEYYNNPNLDGSPALVRYEPDVLFDWGEDSPAPGLPRDGFSVRWTGSIQITLPGPRMFYVWADDRVRLKVDDDWIIQAWEANPNTRYQALKLLGTGEHKVVLEYADEQKEASVYWTVTIPPATPVFAAEKALGTSDTQPEPAPPLPPSPIPAFDPNQVVCNNWFVVDHPVTAQEIQELLESAGTDLTTYRDPSSGQLANQIIANAIETNPILSRYRLNPQFLLVKMEVESNTIWGKRRHSLNEVVTLKGQPVGTIVDWILFYGWPDDPTKVDLSKKGFANQVNNAVQILSSDFEDLAIDGQGRNQWRVGQPYPKEIDGQTVTPANAATAALYVYTPHIYPDKKNIHWAWHRYVGTTVCNDGVIPPPQPPKPATSTSTTFVFDVSGSMDWRDPSGKRKIEAARDAALLVIRMIRRENEQQGTDHQAGIVTFTDDARTLQPLTSEIADVERAIARLEPQSGTNLAAGLIEGARQLQTVTTQDRRILILLSDGVPTVYLDGRSASDRSELTALEQEVLNKAAPQAVSASDCLYVIGFGDPDEIVNGWPSIDEDFLRQIVAATTCGGYYIAETADELANLYVQLRHESTGTLVGTWSGTVAQGDTTPPIPLDVPPNQSELHVTLNWPGSRLDLILTDPQKRTVDNTYPGATLFTDEPPVYAIVRNPVAGTWQAQVYGADVPQGTTDYNLIASTRSAPVRPTPPAVSGSVWTPLRPGGRGPVILILTLLVGVVAALVVAAVSRRPMAPRPLWAPPPPPRPFGTLQVTAPGEPSRTALLSRLPFTIGRRWGCDLALSDRQVSRTHARISAQDSALVLEDLGSTNGTFVNGRQVQRHVLRPGDEIQIGQARLRFSTGH